MTHAHRHGFTLIELSIVLVIIGLIVGGILVGKDMILSAALRKQISQFDQFDAATNTFRSKYNCLPGDCANATDFGFQGIWFQPDGFYPANGNGDGTISCLTDSTGCWLGNYIDGLGENVVFWQHLFQAGLIPQPGACTAWSQCGEIPYLGQITPGTLMSVENAASLSAHGLAGVTIISTADFNGGDTEHQLPGHQAYLVASYVNPASYGPLDPKEVYSIDAKIDDGYPFTGKVRAFSINASGPPSILITPTEQGWAGPGGACVNASFNPVVYDMSGFYGCNMFVQTAF